MNAGELVANYLVAHLGAAITLVLLAASVKLANALAKKYPIPPTGAKWYVKALHFVFVNWPAWESELEGQVKSVVPGKPLPFLSYTQRPPVDSIDQARKILNEDPPKRSSGDVGVIDVGLMLCIFAAGMVLLLVFAGCGPTPAYVRALQIKGEVSDVVLDCHVGWSAARQTMHDNIRTAAPSLEVGLAQLDKLRQVEAKVDAALIVGREAVRKYSEALAEAGAIKRKDWNAAIMEVVAAITTMVAALAEFDVHVKWLPPVVGSKPVTQAIWRGYAREMNRATKCYSFFTDNSGVRFRQVSCEYAALEGGSK